MINVGIVGYGNLGKAVEKELENNKKFNLISIFSRRNINHPKAQLYNNYKNFINKIDIMIMCGGSDKDLPIQSKEMAKFFNIIDTFDNHEKITSHYKAIKQICEKNNTNAIVCAGWDPGLFSCFRVLFSSILNHCECFYGKGISLGHTNALKRIKNVKNAVQYTIPNKKAINLAKLGKPVNFNKHFRLCYVVAKENKKEIINQILNTQNYFKNQKVKVKFVSEKTLKHKSTTLSHKGKIYSTFKNNQNEICCNLNMKTSSNPLFTAKIIIAYLTALSHMIKHNKNTALTLIEIPFSWLVDKQEIETISKFCWYWLFLPRCL